ncbi:MarR family winged helix-turn-helix transcriptional regulator [Flexivirga meconopsidis]|uniref:MarR family winged helix-turn-helix transcriptional regulator n=1 Tax=Flexivirga meconopsidis TaxID=2977121 RepID=UPI00223FD98C|nr:MarR family transcriptional regulator [Flexivirga meconopsidis]
MVKSLTNPFADRPTPLGTLLSFAGRRLGGDLDRALREAGFPDLRAAHAPLFLAIAPEGSTSTELAARAHLTKQSAGELVRYLADHGYLTVQPSPTDGRARLVQLTDAGWRALEVGRSIVQRFDDWLDEQVGADEVRRLRATLDRIIDADWESGASAGRSRR